MGIVVDITGMAEEYVKQHLEAGDCRAEWRGQKRVLIYSRNHIPGLLTSQAILTGHHAARNFWRPQEVDEFVAQQNHEKHKDYYRKLLRDLRVQAYAKAGRIDELDSR